MKTIKDKRQMDEGLLTMFKNITNSPRLHMVTRRVLMSWQMAEHLTAITVWAENMLSSELIQRNVRQHLHKVVPVLRWWFFFRPLRGLHRWRVKAEHAIEVAKLEAIQSGQREALDNAQFAERFLKAVDDDGDGGLSLCELKAAEMGKSNSGTVDPMFRKASIWLQTNRNFQKYDGDSDAILNIEELTNAMVVFLQEHWKYEGVLW